MSREYSHVTLCILLTATLIGCRTPAQKLNIFHDADQYEGPGVYLFLISDEHKASIAPEAETRLFHVMLVNATNDMMFIEDVRKLPALSVTAETVDTDHSAGYSSPVVRWLYRPYLRVFPVENARIKRLIPLKEHFKTPGNWEMTFNESGILIPVEVPNFSIPMQVTIDNELVYSQLGDRYLRNIPLRFEFVLEPRITDH